MSVVLVLLDITVFVSLTGVIIIALGYLSLPLLFFFQRLRPLNAACPPDAQLPAVLVQLAVFNEPEVVTGLLESVARLDWPKDRLHIQLLDDSFDNTTGIAASVIARLRGQGFLIEHLHRTHRTGFKAGALAAGMAANDAPFTAILDADFRPPADWLRSVMGHFFADPRTGFVQSRFEFSNWDVNALTRMQGLMSDAHFVMEQDVRARAGLLFQFNGTAGVLRREAVRASGGWSDDSLAEDLDLVVRMAITGWHGVFVMQPAVAALVPERITDWRVQQRRWASGFAQVARKLLAAIAHADWSLSRKVSAIFLILYQGAFALVTVVIAGLLLEWLARGSLPLFAQCLGGIVLILSIAVAVGMTLPPFVVLKRGNFMRYAGTLLTVPPLLLYLSLANTMPMIAAFFGRRESFKRTPKA